MSGKVWEWCWNEYGKDYITTSFNELVSHTIKGGSINSTYGCKIEHVEGFLAIDKYNDVGFRIGRSVK